MYNLLCKLSEVQKLNLFNHLNVKVQVAIKYDPITERIHKSLKRELTRLHKEFYLRALKKVKTQHSWKKTCRQSEISTNFPVQISCFSVT